MNLILPGSLLVLAIGAFLYCQRAGAHHHEVCRRKAAENRLRAAQQKFFTAQKELIKAKKENHRLAELDRDRSRSLGQSAHELRNPINALDSVFNLLELELKGSHKPSPAVYQSLFDLATEALASMQIQVQKVEDARSDQIAQSRSSRTPIELNALLRQVIALNEIQAAKKAIELRLIDQTRPRIWADHNSCREIVDRLIRTTLERASVGSVVFLKVENPRMNEVAFSIETQNQPLPTLVTEFFRSRKADPGSIPAGSHTAQLMQTLVDVCEEIEAQGGTLQTCDDKQLTVRFPHVRVLTRNPFLELKEDTIEPALEAQSV